MESLADYANTVERSRMHGNGVISCCARATCAQIECEPSSLQQQPTAQPTAARRNFPVGCMIDGAPGVKDCAAAFARCGHGNAPLSSDAETIPPGGLYREITAAEYFRSR